MESAPQRSFGVFKPVGHLVISFARADQADAAARALRERSIAEARQIRRYSDRAMLEQIDADLADASLLASIGQEMNLVKAHRALAERGYHWLVVAAPDDATARRIADCAAAAGAERAQFYGHFVIEELIEHPGDEPQVAESPERQLDSQTLSGDEAERARIRSAPRC